MSLKQFLLVCLLLCVNIGIAQLSKKHYIPPLTSAEFGNANPEEQYIYLSTPTETPINYTIISVGQPATSYITGTVSNSNPQEIFLGTGNGQLFVPSSTTSTVKNNAGYIIEAEDLIYVSVRMNAGNAAQAGALVSKGLASLGQTFRIGSYTNENPQNNYLNFVSVMATEDNTQVTFDNLPSGLIIKNYSGATPVTATLNEGESYTIATNSFDTTINKDGLIGALVTSNNPIVVNCGSTNGSFHNGGGRDYGIDQIVPLEKVGNEYILVKGDGTNNWENVLVVAHFNNTEIFINGNTTPTTTINAGEYYLIEGDNYNSNGNMYVQTSQDVFVYQGVGATTGEANQGMFFVPPLSCETRGNLDNIAHIENIGSTTYQGGVSVVTKTGSTVTINGLPISSYTTSGPFAVDGKSDYETYKVTGLSGNISVESTEELYCAYFNYNGAATSGSFYSGFPTPPEINFDAAFSTLGICIPNITLEAANMGNFDAIEWYFNDGSGFTPTGVTTAQFVPTLPGTYKLIGTLTCSGLTLESYEIPVSICPDDIDNDGIIDNVDIDNDNDGILNCTESLGNENVNLSNLNSGSLSVGNFNYTGTVTTAGNITSTPLIGASDGTILSKIPNNLGTLETSVNYTLNFDNNLNLKFELATSTSLGNFDLTNDEVFIIKTNSNKTITLLNPDDQILVDTDYDGIYESGITEFSSFEIRFKSKNPDLAIGTGTFTFVANNVNQLSYTHISESDTNESAAMFKISATCIPKDNDNDGIEDAVDYDSDNDGIPDIIEYSGNNIVLSGVDVDTNGLDDIFDNSLPVDSDTDGVFDFYDLDSDNDGIFDVLESESGVIDADFDGIIDGVISSVGSNGLYDSIETSPDSGSINYTIEDLDSDAVFNYLDEDTDGDNCSDVIEAGFSDSNNDYFLGNSTVIVDSNGVVTNATDGYTTPNSDYHTSAPITIITQPISLEACELGSTIFSIETNTVDTYQWEISTNNGSSWNPVSNNSTYDGANTFELTVSNIQLSMTNYQYRVYLTKIGNSCDLISDVATLTVNQLPIVTTPVQLNQCDNDTDGFTFFNLHEVDDEISTNASNETITFHLEQIDAINNIINIPDETAFENRYLSNDTVWARVVSNKGCISISQVNLTVTTSAIPSTYQREFYVCDDYLNDTNNDRDGVSVFDFSSVLSEIEAFFPSQPVTINYFRNETDALNESNAITDISNYRNVGYPNSQQIYVRVDSQIGNDCLGLGSAHITLIVEELPIANSISEFRECDDNNDGIFPFATANLENDVLSGQLLTNVSVTYFDESGNLLQDAFGNPITSPFPSVFNSTSKTIMARVTNNNTYDPNGPCFDETEIEFIVNVSPIANSVIIPETCDDESNDGIFIFDTSTLETDVLNGQPGMEVYYYNSLGNQLTDIHGTAISSPFPSTFETNTQTITVEVVNPQNTTCTATTTINFVINPLPEFDVETPRILCITNPQESITLNVFPVTTETFDFEWRDSNNNIISTNETVNVFEDGIYNVQLTKKDGTGCSRTKEIEVIYSETAKINSEDIAIDDDRENNTITINNSNNNLGVGDYEFALDNDFGFQDEPYFEMVTPGIHTIYINDKNGCAPITSIQISVIGYPKFFTPNGDGHNDTWKILGVNEHFYANSNIYIFNRFGKLVAQIDPTGEGWNGIYNGEHLPSSDYWFSVELIDENGNVKIRKGHFSLLRH